MVCLRHERFKHSFALFGLTGDLFWQVNQREISWGQHGTEKIDRAHRLNKNYSNYNKFDGFYSFQNATHLGVEKIPIS
jgi:hypothetical protein